jgi:hypothetical protein
MATKVSVMHHQTIGVMITPAQVILPVSATVAAEQVVVAAEQVVVAEATSPSTLQWVMLPQNKEMNPTVPDQATLTEVAVAERQQLPLFQELTYHILQNIKWTQHLWECH